MGTLDGYRGLVDDKRGSGQLELPKLQASVGDGGMNSPADVAIVADALKLLGLDDGVEEPNVFFAKIRSAQRLIRRGIDNPHLPEDGLVLPNGPTDRGFRLALSLGLLRNADQEPPRRVADAHFLMSRGLSRAHKRLDEIFPTRRSAESRAMLPPVDPAVYVDNRRIAAALRTGAGDGRVDRAIAAALTDGGRQGFANVRDFYDLVNAVDGPRARRLVRKASRRLKGKPKTLAMKLLSGEAPADADFD